MEAEGWPVIFVQAASPVKHGGVRPPSRRSTAGSSARPVVFGDEFTPSGTKFRIAGIVARTREEASSSKSVPRSWPCPKAYRARSRSSSRTGEPQSRHRSPFLEPGSGPSASGDAPNSLHRTRLMSPSRSTGVLIVPSGAVAHAVLLACLSGLCPVAVQAGGGTPTPVKVQKDEAGYHLLRDGQPYVIKGNKAAACSSRPSRRPAGTRCGPGARTSSGRCWTVPGVRVDRHRRHLARSGAAGIPLR